MYRLSHQDSRRLLCALETLNSDFDPKTLPARSLAAAEQLATADYIIFNLFTKDKAYEDTAWSNAPDRLTPQAMAAFGEYLHQHPVIGIALDNPNGVAIRVTDAVSQTAFEKTDLFNEFYRKVKSTHQMGLALLSEGGLTMACAFCRNGKDFTDGEKSIASLAGPHFINALRNGFAFGRLSTALETASTGIVTLDQAFKTTFVSQFARQQLEKYFPKEKLAWGELPESLSDWLKSRTASTADQLLPATPLNVGGPGGELSVRVLQNSRSHEQILLLEEKKRASPESFAHLPVTRREAEILFWITQGKSDGAIAELCGLSIRTVHKHVENIYKKLGVETRTAAMIRASEVD